MNAKTAFYTSLKNRILTTSVKHCLLFNNQIDEIASENTFPFPAVFVEFTSLDWLVKSRGIQKGDAIVRLHVAFNSLKTEELEILELLAEIHAKLQGFSDSDVYSQLNRVYELQDTNHDQIQVWQIDYSTTITDLGGYALAGYTEIAGGTLGLDLIIDDTKEISKPWLKHE